MIEYMTSIIGNSLNELKKIKPIDNEYLNYLDYMLYRIEMDSIVNGFKTYLIELDVYGSYNENINLLNNIRNVFINSFGYSSYEVKIIDEIIGNYNNLLYFHNKLQEITYRDDFITLSIEQNKKIKNIKSRVKYNIFLKSLDILNELLNNLMKLQNIIKLHENKFIEYLVKCEFDKNKNVSVKNDGTYFKISNNEIIKIQKNGEDFEWEKISIDEYFRIWISNGSFNKKEMKQEIKRYKEIYSYYFVEEAI